MQSGFLHKRNIPTFEPLSKCHVHGKKKPKEARRDARLLDPRKDRTFLYLDSEQRPALLQSEERASKYENSIEKRFSEAEKFGCFFLIQFQRKVVSIA
jgi:hypothetical protein